MPSWTSTKGLMLNSILLARSQILKRLIGIWSSGPATAVICQSISTRLEQSTFQIPGTCAGTGGFLFIQWKNSESCWFRYAPQKPCEATQPPLDLKKNRRFTICNVDTITEAPFSGLFHRPGLPQARALCRG